jgi:hypothetical protein
MNSKAEERFEKVTKYQNLSIIIMSIITSYHIVSPKSLGGVILMIVLVIPILMYSRRILEKVMFLR